MAAWRILTCSLSSLSETDSGSVVCSIVGAWMWKLASWPSRRSSDEPISVGREVWFLVYDLAILAFRTAGGRAVGSFVFVFVLVLLGYF
ncbi:hypothetical protein BJY04DRAFT_190369 [Aspergillus karnatakaensis]|uniref:uncharacterized protein n=1 Tax=Aspergillus karnatakaensis TaxID=1810916 RepID=UPI003CCD5826